MCTQNKGDVQDDQKLDKLQKKVNKMKVRIKKVKFFYEFFLLVMWRWKIGHLTINEN